MQRDIAPDVLRGFALLGILVVNIQYMGLSSAEGARGEWAYGLANGSATFIIASIFAGKFYLLFSFLFGYSSNYIIKGEPANRARCRAGGFSARRSASDCPVSRPHDF